MRCLWNYLDLFKLRVTSFLPFILKLVDPKSGDEKSVVISVDDGIRPGTTLADLSKLKPAFKKSGTTTAGMISPQLLLFL